MATVIQWLEDDYEPSKQELFHSGVGVKQLWLEKQQLRLSNGILYYQWVDTPLRNLFVIPSTLWTDILKGCHDCPTAGHLGMGKTIARLKRLFYWHGGMRVDATNFVKTCNQCNMHKKTHRKARASLGSFRATGQMERIHMDILGPFPKSE